MYLINNKQSRVPHHQSGSILTALIVFVAIGLLITTSATVLLADQMLLGERDAQSASLLYTAESGAENAILRLLRDPSYTGEQLPTADGLTIVINVQPGPPIVITSQVEASGLTRTVQVELTRLNGVLEVQSWQQINN